MDGAGGHIKIYKMTEKCNRSLGRILAKQKSQKQATKTGTGLGKAPMPGFYDELQIP